MPIVVPVSSAIMRAPVRFSRSDACACSTGPGRKTRRFWGLEHADRMTKVGFPSLFSDFCHFCNGFTLKWSDIDFETGMLTVRAALQRVDKKLIQVETKSVEGYRTINPPAACLNALTKHQAKQEEEQQWAGSKWKESGYVFTTRVGTPMDARDLLRDYYRLTRPKATPGLESIKLPFPAIRFHDLRHSTATILLAEGVPARYLTELLGHSQVSFTMQTYAHVLPEVQKSVATKMDGILNPKPVATTVATKPVLGECQLACMLLI
jgi:hypothetical protein